MKFKTTREDYDKAVEAVIKYELLDQCCLLAQTIRRITGKGNCLLGCTYVSINGIRYQLTGEVIAAIFKFDTAFTNVHENGVAKRVFKKDGFTEIEFELPIEEPAA
jgi:hypothetical protein